MKEAVKCCMQVWMCIRKYFLISVHKSGDKVYYGHSKITEFYRKLKRKGKHENVAIIGAARKLLQTIYYMLKKGESFHG